MTYDEKLAQLLEFYRYMIIEIETMQCEETLDKEKKAWIDREWATYHAPSPEWCLEKLDELIEEEDDEYVLATYDMLYGKVTVAKEGFNQKELADIFSEVF